MNTGMPRAVGNHLYARCAQCGRIVRLNKPLLGSLHVCTLDINLPEPWDPAALRERRSWVPDWLWKLVTRRVQ